MKLSLALAVVTATSVSATNFLIIQPDDMAFYEDWDPPAHLPQANGAYPGENYPAGSNLPWINTLRSDGTTMTSAYATSPKCGTSRYSTVTGRYASRSAVARRASVRDSVFPVEVTIPRAKLEDWDLANVNRANQAIEDGADCSHSNIAQAFSKNGYVTGMVGKWHLTDSSGKNVEQVKTEVMGCGFQKVSAMYPDNIQGQAWTNDHGGIEHNMEYVAHRAVQFIQNHENDDWLLYVNPTVPHGPDILPAMDVDCRITPDGDFTSGESWDIPGMTTEFDPPVQGLSSAHNKDCMAYRQTVKNRAASSNNADLGSIWVDDAIGAIYNALERTGQLDDTVILFQLDHGKVEKDKIWEGGVRIPQFIHWPNGNLPHQFTGLVANIDIGPTFLEIAGIPANPALDSLYPMDGMSWLTAIHGGAAEAAWSNRCLFFENGQDRAVRCGCDKYLLLTAGSPEFSTAMTSGWPGWPNAPPLSGPVEALADLCDNTGSYVTADPLRPGVEAENTLANEPAKQVSFTGIMQCHLAKTDGMNANTVMPDYTTDCTGSVATPSPTVTSQPTLPVAQLDGIPRITDYFPATNDFVPKMKDNGFVLKARVLDNDIRRVSFQLHFPQGGMTNFQRGTEVGCSGQACDFELPVDTTTQARKYGMRIRVSDQSGNEFEFPFDGSTIDFVVADNAAEILDGARTEIRDIINRAFDPDPAVSVNLAAKFVRHIFHDCVGGCDGCVDLLNLDNEGLETPIAALEPVVAMFANPASHGVTRADIWVLAGLEGASGQQPNGVDDNPRDFTMDWYGRPTCDDIPSDQCVGGECNQRRGPHRELPSPNVNTHELLEYFDNAFGFDARDTVAIMGAHTLGGLRRGNSGYNGINGWLGNTRSFGNGYYTNLIGGQNASSPEEELMRGSDWQQVFVDNTGLNTPNRNEWERGVNPDHFVMINADMAIVRDFNGFMDHSGPASGQVTCEFRARRNQCPKAAQTFDIAVEYKFDNDLFVEDFEDAYKRMMKTGFVASQCPDLELCRVPVISRTRKLLRGILGD